MYIYKHNIFLPVHENVQSMKLLVAKITRTEKIRSPKLSTHFTNTHWWSREHPRGHNTRTRIINNSTKLIIKINTFPCQIVPKMRNHTSITLRQFIHHNPWPLHIKPTSEISSRFSCRDYGDWAWPWWLFRRSHFIGVAQISHGSHYAKSNHTLLEISRRFDWIGILIRGNWLREGSEEWETDGGSLFSGKILHLPWKSAIGYPQSLLLCQMIVKMFS